MKKSDIRNIIRSVLTENETSTAYQNFVRSVMDKIGVEKLSSMTDDQKKKFFNYLDSKWTSDQEVNLDEAEDPGSIIKISVNGYPIALKAVDSTHVGINTSGKTNKFFNYNVRQLSDRPYFKDLVTWLKTGSVNHFKKTYTSTDESTEMNEATVYSRKNIKSSDITNWSELPKDVKDLFNTATERHVVGPNEMIGYEGRTTTFSCMVNVDPDTGKIIVQNMHWKNGTSRKSWKSKIHEGRGGCGCGCGCGKASMLKESSIPDWFKNMPTDKQKEYLQKHPNSKISKTVKSAGVEKLKSKGSASGFSKKVMGTSKPSKIELNNIYKFMRDNFNVKDVDLNKNKITFDTGSKKYSLSKVAFTSGKVKYDVEVEDNGNSSDLESIVIPSSVTSEKEFMTHFNSGFKKSIRKVKNETYKWESSNLNETSTDGRLLRLLDKLGDRLANLELKGKEDTSEYKKLERQWKGLDKKLNESTRSV